MKGLPTAGQKNPRPNIRISYKFAGSLPIFGTGIAGQTVGKLTKGSDMHDMISSTLEMLERLMAENFASLDNDALHEAVVALDLAHDRAEQVMLARWRVLKGEQARDFSRPALIPPIR